MGCLEGWTSRLQCRNQQCLKLWDGSQLILGTMYSYDIFAAVPCCADRLKVDMVDDNIQTHWTNAKIDKCNFVVPVHLLLPTGDPPGPAIQLLLRLQPDRQLSPMWDSGENGVDEIVIVPQILSSASSVLRASEKWSFAGLPFFQATWEDVPEQGWAGRVVASIFGLRAARRDAKGAARPLLGSRNCPLLLLVSLLTPADWLIDWSQWMS